MDTPPQRYETHWRHCDRGFGIVVTGTSRNYPQIDLDCCGQTLTERFGHAQQPGPVFDAQKLENLGPHICRTIFKAAGSTISTKDWRAWHPRVPPLTAGVHVSSIWVPFADFFLPVPSPAIKPKTQLFHLGATCFLGARLCASGQAGGVFVQLQGGPERGAKGSC